MFEIQASFCYFKMTNIAEREKLANDKIQGIANDSTCYKILNAMLNGFDDSQFPGYRETKQTIINDILISKDFTAKANI